MKNTYSINTYIRRLSTEEINNFLILNENTLFEKLSTRLNIREYSEKLHKNALHFTLYEYDNLVGFSPCYFNNSKEGKAYISALIVNRNYQGLKLEEKLLNLIKGYAKHNKFKEILLSIHCNNLASADFYEKNAFVKYSKKKDLCVFRFQLTK